MSAHVERTEPVAPCMGGYCHLRDKCLHHTLPDNKHRPAERLCRPGREEFEHYAPFVMFREAPK